MTRRLWVLIVVVVLVTGALPTTPGIADDERPADLLAGEWAVAAHLSTQAVAGEHHFLADFPANAVTVHWARAGSAEDVMAEVSVSRDGRTWSEWLPGPVDEDSDGRFESDRRYSAMVMVEPSRYFRVRSVNVLGQPGASVADLRVSYLNTLAGPETDSLEASAKKKTSTPTPAPTATPAVRAEADPPPTEVTIIPRSAWGANENLRYRNGKEIWPRDYQIPEKVVLHHTETSNDQDAMAAIRAVYYFHTVTKRWGDIGYNYLIDRDGRIYEGRAGGDRVVGGHALSYNRGSLGIAVLGSYKTASITPRAEAAIVALIAAKARAIDPIGQGYFINKVLANIAGHRDCLSTTCPGNSFYGRLPTIRDKVLQRIGYRPTVDVRITDVSIGPAELRTGDRLEVRATVTNTGTAVIPSDAKGPGIAYVEQEDYDQRGLPKVTGKFRLALEGVGASGGRYPYRWGLGRALLPGESAAIVGYVRLTNPQARLFTVALVQEYVKYWQMDVQPTLVTVTGPPVVVTPPAPEAPTAPEPPEIDPGPLPTDRQPAPAAPDPDRAYFAETGHYLAFGFRHYWDKNGGLGQFGYPITTEFREVNPADGREYTVQYFERARFEYHPEHKGTPYEVLLGLLGNQVTDGRNFAPTPSGTKPPRDGARYFAETQQWVSGPLLKYWTDRGGLMTYGYPISPELDEVNPDDGKTYRVQYFERNRLEHHPELSSTPHEVLLGLLGRQVLVERGWVER